MHFYACFLDVIFSDFRFTRDGAFKTHSGWQRGDSGDDRETAENIRSGFSRMVIWLHAHSTNSDPRIIAQYFVDEASSRDGTAARTRSDLGTENCYTEPRQVFFRHDHLDNLSYRCYLYGSSNRNQKNREAVGLFKEATHTQKTRKKKLSEKNDFKKQK